MSSRLFTSRPDMYPANTSHAAKLRAEPAALTNPETGNREPAIGLFEDTRPRYIMPLAEALRLANEIADATETHKEPK